MQDDLIEKFTVHFYTENRNRGFHYKEEKMKEKIQRFGRFLSGMVMPNIAAFIAWGFITALFIPTGWLPNEKLGTIVGPMLSYLLPILIGYTGGKMIYGQRGAVVGAIATFGVLVGADIPMFIGAMVAGPLGGWCIKKFDQLFEDKIPAGFEMLINNFSAGILGMILAILGCLGINPICIFLNNLMGSAVNFFVANGLLPLASIFVEPAKVLFLNNAINHGILSPLGIEQVAQTGRSLFFLVEANPGPGLGILLAYWFAGKGNAKDSAPGAMIIQFLGGIHEIYFPYVLMNPLTIIALICGGASGILINTIFQSGLVAPASPGSIFAILAMTERSSYLGVILSVVVSAAVTCLVGMVILKFSSKEDMELDGATDMMQELKNTSKGIEVKPLAITRLYFACDAGMGSSAMGATNLTKKLKNQGYALKVEHCAIENLPVDAEVIVTHESLVERVTKQAPRSTIYTITNFMGGTEYDEIIEKLKKL